MTTLADPLSLTRLLDEAVRLARRNFRTIYPPVAIPVALAFTLMSAMQAGMGMGLGGERTALLLMGGFGVALLIAMLVSMGGYAALICACVDVAAGRPVDMRRAWSTLFKPRVFGTWILAGLGMTAGMVCCLLPGIYAVLAWSLITPVLLEEQLSGFKALGRSHQLMTHNPSGNLGQHPMLNAFLVFVSAALISYAAGFVVALPMMLVMGFVVARGVMSGNPGNAEELMQSLAWVQVPTQFASQLVRMAVQVFSMMALALLYFEMRRRLEGDDLDAAVDRVGLAPVEP